MDTYSNLTTSIPNLHKKRRCNQIVKDPINKKYRKCKHKVSSETEYCTQHCILHKYDNNQNNEGQCCFCKDECNPLSQSCGKCARIIAWYGLAYLNEVMSDDICIIDY